ncbi:BrnT family toxin [Acidithiobacillus sp. VAN18-1]|uniref:BrnT family toxin n=1 Tax=Igneacidithiobacillus copahuensis TaxID=2724909 RepID=A0AAE3CJQ8_9PROT|nr:BrnT family toxin [Igneacidithiobacillus copahuensis]MBU2788073.1 BrnT family toxin [Igneacidithiobacillus copahuensis]MBU2796118.1 BrnT family toxin [Acidithiobacillus sp. VAN18-2]
MDFEWDETKARLNLKNHRVAFEDAAWVFSDRNRIEAYDGRDNYGEDRWVTVGLSGPVLLSVVYTVRGKNDGEVIRLISARKATKDERESYNQVLL